MGDFLDPDPHEVQKSAEHFKEKGFLFFVFKIYFINTNSVKPLKKLNISMSNLYEFFLLTSNFYILDPVLDPHYNLCGTTSQQ